MRLEEEQAVHRNGKMFGGFDREEARPAEN